MDFILDLCLPYLSHAVTPMTLIQETYTYDHTSDKAVYTTAAGPSVDVVKFNGEYVGLTDSIAGTRLYLADDLSNIFPESSWISSDRRCVGIVKDITIGHTLAAVSRQYLYLMSTTGYYISEVCFHTSSSETIWITYEFKDEQKYKLMSS